MGRKAALKMLRRTAKEAASADVERYKVRVTKVDANKQPLDGTFFLNDEHWKAKYKKFKRIWDNKSHTGRTRYA